MKFILGKKLEMSQIFDTKGNVIPITLVEAGPCYVTEKKTKEKHGYQAVQIGYQKLKDRKIKKPMKGKPFYFLREFRVEENKQENKEEHKDSIINVSIFQEGDIVKVSGISKGKGFQGGVKRWGFKGRGASHGVKHEARTLGSVGSSFPERVIKGKKMPGRMGSNRVTVQNLKIVKIDKERNIIAVKGAVPGKPGTLLEIRG
ncbi:MAG: 50S ribosomal protein L3 [Candidatus Nealsonbacteria bacterium]|nr:50S ribosomal protein L3 [Candidatus Nealsonbacteria bacterium]